VDLAVQGADFQVQPLLIGAFVPFVGAIWSWSFVADTNCKLVFLAAAKSALPAKMGFYDSLKTHELGRERRLAYVS
jgi:hypothetical protein